MLSVDALNFFTNNEKRLWRNKTLQENKNVSGKICSLDIRISADMRYILTEQNMVPDLTTIFAN